MRSNTEDAARRAYLSIARGTLDKASDKSRMQEVDVHVLDNELLTGVERFQPYGISSVPMPADKSGGKAAEVVVLFVNGNRSHPIVIAVDDRRHRPKDWKPGDAGLYHHDGSTAKFTDTGWVHDAGSKKQPHKTTIGNATVTIADGKITCDVNGSTVVVEDGKVTTTVKGTVLVVTDGKISFGSASASIPIMLESGPSSLLFSSK
jgi:phage baseplate assembly protein V